MRQLQVLFIAVLLTAGCTSDPASSLIRLESEPAGDNCEHGGTKILSGVDENEDGTLSDDEATATTYACNDADTAALVRLEPEPAGGNCALGGTKVLSGLDANGNGELDAEEVNETEYVCQKVGAGTVWQGDYTVQTPADALALKSVRHITGALFVKASSVVALTLPNLQRVDGALEIEENDALESLSLPALTSVGHRFNTDDDPEDADAKLSIWENTVLSSVSLPALAMVENLDVDTNPALKSLSLPSLQTVVADIQVGYNDTLLGVELPALKTAGGYFYVQACPALESLSLSELASVTEFQVNGNENLKSLSAPNIEKTSSYLHIYENAKLKSVSLPKFKSTKSMAIDTNDVLETLSLPALTTVTENIGISDSDHLVSIELPLLENVGWEFTIAGNKSLVSLSVPTLKTAKSFQVKNNESLPQCRVLEILARIQPAPSYATNTAGNDEAAVCND